MARDLAIVRGFTGTRTSEPFFTMVTMGPQPSGCAAYIRVATGPMRPRVDSSLRAFQILVMREPPAHGTTTWAGARQPSCSAIS